MQIAVNDADRVDFGQTLGQAQHRARRALRIEREAGLADRVGHALFERRAFDAAVHVLERDPGQLELAAEPLELKVAGIDQPNHERRRRHAFVQPAERDGFLLDDGVRLARRSRRRAAAG